VSDGGVAGAEDLTELTFEQLIDRLETITRRMAAGDIGIEEVADLYEEAGRLHAAATDRLENVRRRIETLAPPEPADPSE
jgi:exodeoxyribonuclease VII small subunit